VKEEQRDEGRQKSTEAELHPGEIPDTDNSQVS
jgi:hypothetical protein